MRTSRLSPGALVIVVLLGGLAGAVLAQSEDTSAPEISTVTGNRLTLELDGSTAVHPDGDPDQYHGLVAIETLTWSDPRLPSDMRSVLNLTADRVMTGAVRLDGPEGSWNGTWEAFAHEDGTGEGMLRLTGADAYDGLIAFLHGYTDDASCVECMRYDGIIFEGQMPPMPEPVEAAAE